MTTNTKSAICIIPPIEYLSHIQDIRSKQDKAYERWMPHINLVFPFLESDKIDESVAKLKTVLSDVIPFAINFSQFNAFIRKKDANVYLTPDDSGNITDIYNLISHTLNLPPNERGYHPHLTVGQFKKKDLPSTLQKMLNEFEPHQFSYLCDSICIVERTNDTPFVVKHVIKLGKD